VLDKGFERGGESIYVVIPKEHRFAAWPSVVSHGALPESLLLREPLARRFLDAIYEIGLLS